MATTYEPIATLTFTGTTSTGTFSSIPATYTDLRIIFTGTSTAQSLSIRFNGDTGTNYSRTGLQGTGAVASSFRTSSASSINIATLNTTPLFVSPNVFSYAGSTYKTILSEEARDQNGSGNVVRTVGLWQDTAAITSITLFGASSHNITGTATLYGILKA
jgi:hypothetical protein